MPAASLACAVGLHLVTHHVGNAYEDPDTVIYVDGQGNEVQRVELPKQRKHLRAFNPGAWINCNGPTAGAFNNSIGHLAVYAGWTHALGPIDITAGWITGYGKPKAVVVPSVRLYSGLRVAVFPPVRDSAGGVHFMWEF